jgi:hypothetical protein
MICLRVSMQSLSTGSRTPFNHDTCMDHVEVLFKRQL